MSKTKTTIFTPTRVLPERIDVYVIGEDNSLIAGAGQEPCVYIEEDCAGRLYEPDVAAHIRQKFGSVVGVMRDTKFRATPREYKTQKMILGKVDLP